MAQNVGDTFAFDETQSSLRLLCFNLLKFHNSKKANPDAVR